MSTIRTAIFPLAGRGTRMLPLTKAIPKDMLAVFDRPALAHVVSEARAAGITRFIFVTGTHEDIIREYFSRAEALEKIIADRGRTRLLARFRKEFLPADSMFFVRQQHPLGLGHAILCARHLIEPDETIAILLPDVLIQADPPCLAQMFGAHARVGGNLVAVDRIQPDSAHQYGIVAPHADADLSEPVFAITDMVEKPISNAPSDMKLTGRYVLDAHIFELLEHTKKGSGGEIQLTDAMRHAMRDGRFHAVRYDGTDHDCGSREGYLRANAAYALADDEFGPAARDILKALLADEGEES